MSGESGRPTLGGSSTPEPGRCGAKIERSDPPRYCRRHPVKGKTRCFRHGGKSLSGIAAPSYKTGEHSRYMPTRLRADYQRLLDDPNLLSLRAEIAAHRAIVDDLKRAVDTGVIAGAQVARLWKKFKTEHEKVVPNPVKVDAALAALDAAIVGAGREADLRRELRQEDDLIEKLTRAENVRMEQLHGMISKEAALVFAKGLSQSVKDALVAHVADSEIRTVVLRAIGAQFEHLVAGRGTPHTGPGRWLGGESLDPAPDDGR